MSTQYRIETKEEYIKALQAMLSFVVQKGNKSLGKPHLMRELKYSINEYKRRQG